MARSSPVSRACGTTTARPVAAGGGLSPRPLAPSGATVGWARGTGRRAGRQDEQDRQGHVRTNEGADEGRGQEGEGGRGGAGQGGEEGDEGAGQGREHEGGEAERPDTNAGLSVSAGVASHDLLSHRSPSVGWSCAVPVLT